MDDDMTKPPTHNCDGDDGDYVDDDVNEDDDDDAGREHGSI